jgi:hypothetical protein
MSHVTSTTLKSTCRSSLAASLLQRQPFNLLSLSNVQHFRLLLLAPLSLKSTCCSVSPFYMLLASLFCNVHPSNSLLLASLANTIHRIIASLALSEIHVSVASFSLLQHHPSNLLLLASLTVRLIVASLALSEIHVLLV